MSCAADLPTTNLWTCEKHEHMNHISLHQTTHPNLELPELAQPKMDITARGMQWLNCRSCCNSPNISSKSQPTTGLNSNLDKTKWKKTSGMRRNTQFSDVWTCKGCDIENGSVLWNMNSYHHELPKDLIAAEAIAQAPKVAVLLKLSHPNRRWWRSASATLYAAKKIHTKSPSDMPSGIGKSEFVLALKGKRVKFQELWGQATSINKTSVMQHTWYDNTTLNKTYRGNCWWQDLGTKNLIPNTCKSGEAALSGNFMFFSS